MEQSKSIASDALEVSGPKYMKHLKTIGLDYGPGHQGIEEDIYGPGTGTGQTDHYRHQSPIPKNSLYCIRVSWMRRCKHRLD